MMQLPTTTTALDKWIWPVASFLGGLLTKTFVDTWITRRNFARDKRFAFLEEQLSKFYWPLNLLLEKDSLMFTCMTSQDGDPESAPSRLGKYVEENMVLSSQQEAVRLIESSLYLAQKDEVVKACVLYVRHVKVSEMMKTAGVHGIPMALGTPYPTQIQDVVSAECTRLQREYNELVRKGAASL